MNSPTIQHCVFHDGGFVLHKITGNGYSGRFSAWFDRAGKLLYAEQILGERTRAIRAGTPAWHFLATFGPRYVGVMPKRESAYYDISAIQN